jgi:hypothetical protein
MIFAVLVRFRCGMGWYVAEFQGWERISGCVEEALDRSPAKNAVTPPIMILVGPGGYGKSELLASLESTFKGRSPTVRLDFAGNPDATPVQVMYAIERPLEERIRGVGSARFPLLMAGIAAITLRGDGRGSVADQLAERLGAGGAAGGAVKGLAANAAKLLPSPDQQALVGEGGAVVGWLVDRVRARQLGKMLDWYARSGNPDGADGSDYGALLALRDRWRESQDASDAEACRKARLRVWRVLCRAFLADLRVFPKAGWLHGERTTNCLLLLDNADAPVGREFLEMLAETRMRATEGADPLVVVAAHGRRPAVQPAVGQATDSSDEKLSYQGWLKAASASQTPLPPWYPVRLAELSLGQVREIVGSHVLSKAEHDAKFTHAVTGGHPGAVRELARVLAAVSDPLPADFGPRVLVNRAVEDTLLRVVCPPSLSDDDLAAMAVFGLTLRPQLKAGNSVFRSLTWTSMKELDVLERFQDLMWVRAGDAFEILPLYRWLLARWLARDSGRWRDAHDGFLAHYRRHDPIAMRYHQLALTTMTSPDNLHEVVNYLAGQFARLGDRMTEGQRVPADLTAKEWNDMLAAITTAPNRLVEADADRQQVGAASILPHDPWEVVRRIDQAGQLEGLPRIITRLVAARWLHNDLVFDPKRKTALLLAEEYLELARITPGDAEVFYAEARRYRKIVREWEDSW